MDELALMAYWEAAELQHEESKGFSCAACCSADMFRRKRWFALDRRVGNQSKAGSG